MSSKPQSHPSINNKTTSMPLRIKLLGQGDVLWLFFISFASNGLATSTTDSRQTHSNFLGKHHYQMDNFLGKHH